MKRVLVISLLGVLSVALPMQGQRYETIAEAALIVQSPTAAQCASWYESCRNKAETAWSVCKNLLQGTDQECEDDFKREWEACSQAVQNSGCPPPSSPSPRTPCPFFTRICLPDPRE